MASRPTGSTSMPAVPPRSPSPSGRGSSWCEGAPWRGAGRAIDVRRRHTYGENCTLKGFHQMQRALRNLARVLRLAACAALVASPALVTSAWAQTLRIGLSEDPALLDPAQSGTLGERAVFASLCDKLVELSPTGDMIPALAT